MKKLLIVCMTMAIAAASAHSAQAAQDLGVPTKEAPQRSGAALNSKLLATAGWVTEKPEGDSIFDFLNTLQDKYKFIWVRGADTDVQFLTRRVCVSQSPKPLVNLIENVLKPAGFTAEFKGELVTVSSNGAPAPKDPVNCTEMIAKLQDQDKPLGQKVQDGTSRDLGNDEVAAKQRRASVNMNPLHPDNSFPVPIIANKGVNNDGYAMAARTADAVRVQTWGGNTPGYGYGYTSPASYSWSTPVVPYGYSYGYAGSYGQRGYGVMPSFCSYYPGDRNCEYGSLRIDAETKGMSEEILQAIDLYIDGVNYGPVSKYNRWPNKGAKVRVGKVAVQFVQMSRKTGEKLKVYETTAEIRSDYVMRGEPNILRLDGIRMFNGPYRSEIEHETAQTRKPEELLVSPRPKS